MRNIIISYISVLAVMALRDASDPVLADFWARRVAWYHSSTDAHWPGSTREMPPSAIDLPTRTMPPESVRCALVSYETQAFHLGSYEAAIESMLCRMRNQDDGAAQFYLYRVALRRDLIIEQGWRDENLEDAAQVTHAALGSADAIRYLNVRESPGAISLAVRRTAIRSVLGTSIPVRILNIGAEDPLLRKIALRHL